MMNDYFNLTIVVDNSASDGLVGEHGLSLWVEAGDARILFDTGAGRALVPNTQALGIDLSTATSIVLSHGHYDHTGGLADALRMAPGATVYYHPDTRGERYSVRGGCARSIGMPGHAAAALDQYPAHLKHEVTGPCRIAPGVWLTGPVPRDTAFEDTGGPFYLDPAGTVPDPIEDDLAMWVETPTGLVVCFGCAHAGAVNTLDLVRRHAGPAPIHTVVGGLHLVNADRCRVAGTIAALKQFSPEVLVPCHCTGEGAFARIADAMPGVAHHGHAGMMLNPGVAVG